MPDWKNGCKSEQTSWGITASPNNGIQKKRPRRVGDSNVAGPLCCSLVDREDLALAGAAEQSKHENQGEQQCEYLLHSFRPLKKISDKNFPITESNFSEIDDEFP